MSGDPAARPVELWPTASPTPDVTTFSARAGDRVVADVVVVRDPAVLRVGVARREEAVASGTELAALVAIIVERSRADGWAAVVLSASDLRLRFFARAAGFRGPLRTDLTLDVRSPGPARPPLVAGRGASTAHPSPSLNGPSRTGPSLNGPSRNGPSPTGPSRTGADRLAAELGTLLPGVNLATARPPGVLRALLRSAASGVSGTMHLTAALPDDSRPLQVAVPLSSDVMAEGVALAIDTALTVRARFRPQIDRVRVFFDEGVHGMRAGTIAGVAEPTVRDVHLNSAYASAAGSERLEGQRAERLTAVTPDPTRRHPLTVLAPCTRLDAIVAHEFWHQIEFELESERYHDSVEFRRVLGHYFGVDTLEQVIKGNRGDAPVSWQAARARLAGEVSEYATTAPKEATAELFAQWWCTTAGPPPSAQFFGGVLRQFFPSANLVR